MKSLYFLPLFMLIVVYSFAQEKDSPMPAIEFTQTEDPNIQFATLNSFRHLDERLQEVIATNLPDEYQLIRIELYKSERSEVVLIYILQNDMEKQEIYSRSLAEYTSEDGVKTMKYGISKPECVGQCDETATDIYDYCKGNYDVLAKTLICGCDSNICSMRVIYFD